MQVSQVSQLRRRPVTPGLRPTSPLVRRRFVDFMSITSCGC
jgi:hypothetical protein